MSEKLELNSFHATEKQIGQALFLMQGIIWQESILQSYRNYLVVSQSIFLAVGVLILGIQMETQSLMSGMVLTLIFFLTAILAILTLRFLNRAIIERIKSVDWWQKRLLKHENTYSSNMHFTTYRMEKEQSFKSPEIEAGFLNQRDLDTLFRPGIPNARRVFGFFVPGFYLIWVILIIGTIFYFPWNPVIGKLM